MVSVFRYHEISESSHRIMNPLSVDKVLLIGDTCRIGKGTRLLDLACGKDEMLCLFARDLGASGVGIDIHAPHLADARARATELGVERAVTFVEVFCSATCPPCVWMARTTDDRDRHRGDVRPAVRTARRADPWRCGDAAGDRPRRSGGGDPMSANPTRRPYECPKCGKTHTRCLGHHLTSPVASSRATAPTCAGSTAPAHRRRSQRPPSASSRPPSFKRHGRSV